MKWKNKMAGLLAVLLTLVGAGNAFAAGEQTTTIPVTLTVVHSVQNLDVTMPAAMPVSLLDGKVLTANNVEIVNNSSYVDVEVTSVRVENGAYRVGNYDAFPEKETGLIAMSINGCPSHGPGALTLTETAFPIIRAGKALPIEYRARLNDTQDISGQEVAHVIFTLRAVSNQGGEGA